MTAMAMTPMTAAGGGDDGGADGGDDGGVGGDVDGDDGGGDGGGGDGGGDGDGKDAVVAESTSRPSFEKVDGMVPMCY